MHCVKDCYQTTLQVGYRKYELSVLFFMKCVTALQHCCLPWCRCSMIGIIYNMSIRPNSCLLSKFNFIAHFATE